MGMAEMAGSSLAPGLEPARYPLSYTQEWFVSLDRGDDGGAFGPRFISVGVLRVAGHVDLAVLQDSLDDVVARHELLRSLVVRDADPPYQVVLPPCRVPLEVRDLPAVGKSRDAVVRELLLEAEKGSISAREVPLMKVALCRFDDRDSVLLLTVHHSVSDGWSVNLVFRDLGAFYTARRTGTAAVLPQMRQYHEYVAWQRASATSTAEDGAPAYWRHQLDGAREFTIPNDHGHPDSYSRPYSQYTHDIEPDVIAAASALATAARATLFTVMLSAFYILAHELTGSTDLAIRAFTAGRDEQQFQNTMGLFINCVPFRTDIAGCASFRDIVKATRDTFVDAVAHELPVNVLEQAFPDFVTSRENLRTSQFIIANQQGLGDENILPIAESSRDIGDWMVEGSEVHDIPTGVVWNLTMRPSGELRGGVLYNLDEFDASTVVGWAASLRRILAGAVREPDRDWRTLVGLASRHEDRV
jgi:condensation enzyme